MADPKGGETNSLRQQNIASMRQLFFVSRLVGLDRLPAVAPDRDDRDVALILEHNMQAVGDQPLHALGLADEQVRSPEAGRVARRQAEAERPASKSMSAWIFVVRSLREMPMAWARAPFCAAGTLVRLHAAPVDPRHLGDPPLIGQRRHNAFSHAPAARSVPAIVDGR